MLQNLVACHDATFDFIQDHLATKLDQRTAFSGLLVDSVRVLSRCVQRAKGLIAEQVSNVQQLCRSRLRTARRVAQTLHRQLRRKGEHKEAQQKELYQKLIQSAEQVVQQSRRVLAILD